MQEANSTADKIAAWLADPKTGLAEDIDQDLNDYLLNFIDKDSKK